MNNLLKEYFTITNSQRRAILTLAFLIACTSIASLLLPYVVVQKKITTNNDLLAIMQSIEADTAKSPFYYIAEDGNDSKPSMLTPFRFNPNTMDETGFKKLGLRDKLIKTILNYRGKGGKFYNKESLKRIYGLRNEEYKQLEKYISIPENGENNQWNKFPKEIKTLKIVELNSADTSALIQLKGIGSKLSANIIKRREQLGGFTAITQLNEVYGISAETFKNIQPYVRVNLSTVKKINLNEATYYELNKHPYLKGEIALALVEYRKSHHYKFNSLLEIKEIELINEEIFRKIVPYLSIH